MKPHIVVMVLSFGAAGAYIAYRALQTDGANETESGPAAAATDDSRLVDSLPDFVLDDLAGNPTPIQSLTGKPLLVNFWATWCAPCLREIPMLKAYQEANPDIRVVGIAIDRVDPVVAFAEEMQFNYPVLVGPEAMNAAGAFGVDFVAMPFSVFAAAGGSVLAVHTGELHTEHLEQFDSVIARLASGTIGIAEARAMLAGRM
jgi:thiol-disulfide isomerase/thioredoxin